MERMHGRAVALLIWFLALGFTAVGSQSADAPAMLTADQWRADLHYLAEQMPLHHKNVFHTMTPQAFHRAVDQLDADIPHLNDDAIAVRLYAIATMPEDSHTGGLGYPTGTYFPLRLRRYDDGLYLESAPAKYAAAVGGRVVRIGTTDAEAAYQRLQPIVPHDSGNPGLLQAIGPALLCSGHVLHGLGVEPTADSATFTVAKGAKTVRLNVTPDAPFEALYGYSPLPGWVDARNSGASPLWLMHPNRPYWSTYVAATHTFYIQFNQVLDAKDESVEHFFADAFAQASRLPVDKLVLDVRLNNGGNNYLLKPVIVGLIRMPSIDRPGHLFVVTSRSTYSAAQNLVNRLELYTDAIFVGQPTGEHVNSYGDAFAIALPNSHIRLGVSSVWWQDGDERDKRIETDPAIAAVPTFADYVANRDPAMNEIARYQPEERLEDVVLHGVQAANVEGGLAAYRAYAATPVHRFVRARMEPKINALGYKLLGEHQLSQAIAVLAVNALANPHSANAADSLGEAYAAAGQREKAIASYRRALQMSPALESSRKALEQLDASNP